MIKLLIGGSPCTFWSIAQKNGRETEASGMGWELFKNYLIAKDKFKPDYFLYENNKSAAQPIKDQISKELGVDLMYINSALVSAQNRQRFYAFNWKVEQPEDRGIVLRDILESGVVDREKAYPLLTTHQGNARDYFKKQHAQIVLEPTRIGDIGSTAQAHRVYSCDGKLVTLSANGGGQGGKTGLYATPYELSEEYYKGGEDGSLIGMTTNGEGKYRNGSQPSQQYRVYSCDGKSQAVNTLANENYIAPVDYSEELVPFVEKKLDQIVEKYSYLPERFNPYNTAEIIDKAPTLTTQASPQTNSCTVMNIEKTNGKERVIYEVKGGFITIKGKQYPIKLADGHYIIRKLTVKECCRLQTLPDDYCRAVSNSQAYKGLGNGWTAEVIIHILNGALKDVPRDEEIVVLSMYDGIGTGRYCLDKMGFTNVRYYAYEIDKYAKQVSMSNYPDIIQCGDAFDLRHPDWTIGY